MTHETFLSFSRDPETPPHLEPEVDALVRSNGPLALGLAGFTRLCPDLPSSFFARRWRPAVQAGHWVGPAGPPVPPFSIADDGRHHARGGGRGRQGTREAGVTVPVPTPGPLQLQTSASPRSYIHTSSAWASVCPCAEVSCSLGRAAGPVGVGRCFWGLLCPPLGQGAGPNASGLAVLAVEGPSWDRQAGDKGSRSSIRPSYIVWQQRWQWLLEEQLLLGEHSVLHDRLRLVQTYSSQGGIIYSPFSGGHC